MNKDEFKRQISKIQTAYNKIFTKEEMKSIPVTIVGIVKQLKRIF